MVDFDVKNTPQGLKYDTFYKLRPTKMRKGKAWVRNFTNKKMG